MATIKEQEHLMEVLKFTPRTYKVELWGYGGEYVMGTVSREIYDYFRKHRLSVPDYAWGGDEFDDVPEDIVAEDLLGYPARIGVPVPAWGTPFMPGGPNFAPERGPLGPGVVIEEAAAIDVPVFIGNGEIDTCPDPLTEPTAYPKSLDVTTIILPRSSHMHNFAGTREILWKRLQAWAVGIKDSWN